MRTILKYFFIGFILLAHHAISQSTRFRVTHYDETMGLQTNVISTIIQDKKGYMWFGTGDGLYRYDGYTFRSFKKNKNDKNGLQNNNILKLAEDKDGKIWMGLADGISSYDPATGVFTNYDVSNINPASSFHAMRMLFIDKENNVWAGLLQNGLIKLDKASGKFFHYDIINDSTIYSKEFRGIYNNVYSMVEANDGLYWLATHDGLYSFNSKTKQMHAERTSIPPEQAIRTDLFNSIAPDKNGLWLGAYAGGLSYYNTATKAWKNYKYNFRNKNVATANIINAISFNKDGELWIASSDKGIGAFDTATKRFDFCSDDSATRTLLPSKFCSVFYRDRQDNLWLVFPDGLYKVQYFEKRFQYIPLSVTKSTNDAFYGTTAILDDSETNTLFIGTNFADGLHVTDKTSGKTIILPVEVMPQEENSMIINDIMKDHTGTIWITSRDCIYQYDQQQKKLVKIVQPSPYTKSRPSNSYNAIKEDTQGNIWISSYRNGIFCYDVNTKTYKHFNNQPGNKNSLPFNVATCLTIDQHNNIWVGSSRGSLGYINKNDIYVGIKQSRQQEHFLSLFIDRKGNLWAGTDNNLYYYSTTDFSKPVKVLNEENGLKGQDINSINEDAEGNTWCITNNAICKVLKNDKIVSYGRLDGIDNAYSLGGIYILKNNKIALTTYGGYYVFDPKATQLKKETSPLVITSFKIDDKEEFYQHTVDQNKQIIVPANANVISFEYAALDFSRADKQQYQYQLNGIDKDWVNAAQRRYVSYSNLPGGDYIFKVRTVGDDDNEQKIISLSLHVVQPFYKTWWFIISVMIILFCGIYFFYHLKLKRQRQLHSLETKAQLLEKEKTLAMYEGLKQQLNPHFLFNSLTSLNSLINYDQKKASEFLEGLSKIYRYILKSRNTETVELTEEIKFVQTFIQLQQTRFKNGLIVNIKIAEDLLHCKIVPVTLQNMIENAIKHNIIDEESPLKITIKTEQDYIVVKNNLQKKNFVETSNKQGLNNLISLYHYLTAKPVLIEETQEQFTIKIPLL